MSFNDLSNESTFSFEQAPKMLNLYPTYTHAKNYAPANKDLINDDEKRSIIHNLYATTHLSATCIIRDIPIADLQKIESPTGTRYVIREGTKTDSQMKFVRDITGRTPSTSQRIEKNSFDASGQRNPQNHSLILYLKE